jgi:hypothetical protein
VARAAFFSIAETGQYLGGWTPWHSTTELPDGVAFELPARSRIAIDVLYRGIAEMVIDKPTLALYLANNPRPVPVSQLVLKPSPERSVSTASPPRVRAEITVPVSSRLLSMRVDMAPGAKSLEIKTRRPDGVVQVLLLIKEYSQQWQTPYIFRQPIAVPKDSLIQATAYFTEQPREDSRSPFTVTFQTYQDSL